MRLFASATVFTITFAVVRFAAAKPVHFDVGDFSFEIPETDVCAVVGAEAAGVEPCAVARGGDAALANNDPKVSVVTVLRFLPPNPVALLVVMQAPKTPTYAMDPKEILQVGNGIEQALRDRAPGGAEVSPVRSTSTNVRDLPVVRFTADVKLPPGAPGAIGARHVHSVVVTSEATYTLAFIADESHLDTLDALAATVTGSVRGNPPPSKRSDAYSAGYMLGRVAVFVLPTTLVLAAFVVRARRRDKKPPAAIS